MKIKKPHELLKYLFRLLRHTAIVNLPSYCQGSLLCFHCFSFAGQATQAALRPAIENSCYGEEYWMVFCG